MNKPTSILFDRWPRFAFRHPKVCEVMTDNQSCRAVRMRRASKRHMQEAVMNVHEGWYGRCRNGRASLVLH